MEESILATIKKMLGLDASYLPFDNDIVVFINGALMTLQQCGVGPKTGFTVTGYDQAWCEFLPSDTLLEGAKQYIYLQVKMGFDPPANSFVMTAMEKQSDKLEWRLREQAEFFADGSPTPGYWQKIQAEEDAAKEDSIDNGLGPFNGLKGDG